MKKNLVKGLFLSLGALCSIASCGNKEVNKWNDAFTKVEVNKVDTGSYKFVNEGKLTVAMSTDFAPMEFIDLTKTGQDKYVGADVCLAKTIADAFGLELVIKSMDFDVTLVSLDQGTCDVAISGFSYTEARAASYLYTDCYYSEGDGGQVVVVAKDKVNTYNSFDVMNAASFKIGAQTGSLQYDLVTSQLTNATLVEITDLNSAYDQLNKGALDGIAIAKTVADTLVEAYPEKYAICAQAFDINDEGNFALVKKGNETLANLVNQVIKQVSNSAFQKWVDEGKALFAGLGDNASEDISSEDE